jgi:hypothetical protein
MQYGVTWTPVTSAAEAAEYVVKLQDGRDPGLEVARGDLKAGRLGSVTPFEILDYFARTGDADALELWNRYEVVSKHRQCITWSKGLRRRLLPDEEDELTDEEAGVAPYTAGCRTGGAARFNGMTGPA